MIDGIPFGTNSVIAGGGGNVPDLDPGILQRIEVLRGPQGTLFGASSIGGVVNFVTAAPSTDAVSGRVEGDLNSVHDGHGPGYGWRGALNVPLSDTLAVRVNAYTRHDTGYIDNIQTGQGGVNSGNTSGGRLAALWHPDENLSLQVNAMLQNSATHGDPQVFLAPGFGDLQQSDLIGTGWGRNVNQDYSATLKVKLGIVDVTSNTAYNISSFVTSYDTTPISAPLTQPIYGLASNRNVQHYKTDKFTQELRFAAPLAGNIDWLFGMYYSHEASPYLQQDYVEDQKTGVPVALFDQFAWSSVRYFLRLPRLIFGQACDMKGGQPTSSRTNGAY